MEGATGFQEVEARDVAKHPKMLRTVPSQRIIQLRMSTLTKLRNSDIYSVADKDGVLEPDSLCSNSGSSPGWMKTLKFVSSSLK